MKYFKIMIGYDDFISIDENELQKAIYAQIIGNITATFKNGSIVGNRIAAIVPDFHRTMGWNYAHKLGPDDHDEINQKGISKEYSGMIGKAKDQVNYLIATRQTNLIGKEQDIKKIS